MYEVARCADAENIRKFAIEFTATLGEPCDPDHYIAQWIRFMNSGIGVIWELRHDGDIVGGIGGIVAPDILNGKPTLIELFWYVTPSHRSHGILLFREMERYVNDNNLRWAMIHMERSMPEKLKLFYSKQGFRLQETHWIKGD
jgi:GNAT superfamily N-acetyltransferase